VLKQLLVRSLAISPVLAAVVARNAPEEAHGLIIQPDDRIYRKGVVAMSDLAGVRAECRQLAARLEGKPDWAALRAIYLDMATVAGRIQGAVSEARRASDNHDMVDRAEAALTEAKGNLRQVGLDIRLASPAALALGLRSAVGSALEALDHLQRMEE